MRTSSPKAMVEPRAARRRGHGCRRSTSAAGRTSRPTGAATGRSGSSWCCSCCRCSPNSSPTTGRCSPPTRARSCFRSLVDYPEEKFGGFHAVTDYRDPVIHDEIEANGWMIWPPIRYSYRTVNNDIPDAAPAKPSWMLRQGRRAASAIRKGVNDPQLHDRQLELARHRRPGAATCWRASSTASASRCCSG